MTTDNTANKDFPPAANLISTTDPDSYVTYANEDFCSIAGYQENELIGKAHNLVRHSDMPKSAFKQMWTYLSAGKSWMGLVKNKCKENEHYWVSAFVTPIKDEQGNIIEFQSVRSKPTSDQVSRAETLYARLRNNLSTSSKRVSYLKLIIGLASLNVTLVPALFIFINPLVGLASLFACNILLAACLTRFMARLRHISTLSEETYANELMEKPYTGFQDDFSQIQLALMMKSAQLRAVSARAEDTASKILQSAEEEFATIQTIDTSIDQQCLETEQVATAIEELTYSINEVSSSAASSSTLTSEASKKSKEGLQSITDTIQAVDSLALELEESKNVIYQLAQDSKKIDSILDVISAISDQTNLLALNAAIEAARAGEAGRGFAVVADEVRNLASKTGSSASEIHLMINQLQSTADNAVQTMQKGSELSAECKQRADSTGQVLTDIYQRLDEVADSSHQIAAAVDQQSSVTKEINTNITRIRSLASSTSETSSLSIDRTRKLVDDIEQLRRLMNQFRS